MTGLRARWIERSRARARECTGTRAQNGQRVARTKVYAALKAAGAREIVPKDVVM